LASNWGRCGCGCRDGEDVNEDLLALSTLSDLVEVVEGTAQALVPDGRATERKGAVGTGGETTSVDGTSLSWSVELELLVGGNVSGAVLAVSEDTVLEGDLEDVGTSLVGAL